MSLAMEPGASSGPWWRHGMMWLVVGGPLVVVVAAIITAVIAIRGADPLVEEPAAQRTSADGPQVPAMRARNHAATPTPTETPTSTSTPTPMAASASQ